MRAKLIRESIGDVLKPKPKKEIAKRITSEILLEVLNGVGISFFSSSTGTGNYSVFEANYNINKWFDEMHKQKGPGLYYQSAHGKITPLVNVYPNEQIGSTSTTIKFDVQQNEIELALNELILNALEGNAGNGFHLKYYNEINESVFKPKSEDEIAEELANIILSNYIKETIGIGLNYAWKPEIMRNSGKAYFDMAYSKHGKGLYLGVNDDGVNNAYEIIKNNITDTDFQKNSNKIGHSHFLIRTSIANEKKIIKDFCKFMLEEDKYVKDGIDFFNVKKFIR